MMTRSDSGKNGASFVIENSCKLHHLNVLLTHVLKLFFVNVYLHVIQVKQWTFPIYADKVYIW